MSKKVARTRKWVKQSGSKSTNQVDKHEWVFVLARNSLILGLGTYFFYLLCILLYVLCNVCPMLFNAVFAIFCIDIHTEDSGGFSTSLSC